MIAECFLDTNILVYAVDRSVQHAGKSETARRLLTESDFGLSAQVLQEFYVVATRKLKTAMRPEDAADFVETMRAFPVVAVDHGLVTEGIRNSLRYQISYWDGAIVAAAERIRAHTLYSEDLNHAQRFDGVQVVNPFLQSPA